VSVAASIKRYKDVLKTTRKACGITRSHRIRVACSRENFTVSLCKKGIQDLEARRVLGLQKKRSRRKLGNIATTDEFDVL